MHNSYQREEEEVQNEHSYGKRSYYRKARQNQLRILGVQDAPIPCQPRLLELCWRSKRKSTQPSTCQPSSLGTRVGCCTALHHASMITCSATSERPKRQKRHGGTSKRYLQQTWLQESFNSVKSRTTFNRGICPSETTPWRLRSCATPSSRSMSWLTTKKWCKYDSEALRNGSMPYGLLSSQGRTPPPSISSRFYWWKKTMSKRETTHLTDRCSTQTQMKKEDKTMEEGAM